MRHETVRRVVLVQLFRNHSYMTVCNTAAAEFSEISIKSVTAEYCNARPSALIAECARFDVTHVERVRRERKKENKKKMVMTNNNTDFCALLLCMVICVVTYLQAG